MVVTFIFLLFCAVLITMLYCTDTFGKKNELDYFLASQKLLGMLPFIQLSTCIIQLGGLCLGSLLVISFNDNTVYAMESDSAVVKLDDVRKEHISTSKNALDHEAEKLGEFQSGSKRQKGMMPDLANSESLDCQTSSPTLCESSAPENNNSGYLTPTPSPRKACFLDLIDMNYRYTGKEEFLERNGFHNGIKIVDGEEYCIDIKLSGPSAPLPWKDGEPVPCNDALNDPAYRRIPGFRDLSFCITKKNSTE